LVGSFKRELHKGLTTASTVGDILRISRKGDPSSLSPEDRAQILADAVAGRDVRLVFDAVTYIQRDTPNRRFVRFKAGALVKLAASFAGSAATGDRGGVPFLRDHEQDNALARGGTVLESKLVDHNGVARHLDARRAHRALGRRDGPPRCHGPLLDRLEHDRHLRVLGLREGHADRPLDEGRVHALARRRRSGGRAVGDRRSGHHRRRRRRGLGRLGPRGDGYRSAGHSRGLSAARSADGRPHEDRHMNEFKSKIVALLALSVDAADDAVLGAIGALAPKPTRSARPRPVSRRRTSASPPRLPPRPPRSWTPTSACS
jgi:hypothetical protein